MHAKLIVKNFGPLRDIDVELRNVNVLIGAQASGKSALAKIYTICKSPLAFINKPLPFALAANGENKDVAIENFKIILEEYNISSFLEPDTFIEFDAELHYFKYENGELFYKRKLLKEIQSLERMWIADEDVDKTAVADLLNVLNDKLFNFSSILVNKLQKSAHIFFSKQEFTDAFIKDNYTTQEIKLVVDNVKELEAFLEGNTALYIPAERNFIPIIKGASLNLLNNNVPIPKHILSFGSEYEKASFALSDIDLSFVKEGLGYVNDNGIDFIIINGDKKIRLTQAASGLQSIIPLLLPIMAQKKLDQYQHKSFVIEEPELNLFPDTQYNLIQSLEEQRQEPLSGWEDFGVIHTYTTHSPFILSAFNNLLFANKVQRSIRNYLFAHIATDKSKHASTARNEVEKIVSVTLYHKNFSAYQLANGKAESIVENGLIKENFIDQTSDKLGEDFEALMDLMEQYK